MILDQSPFKSLSSYVLRLKNLLELQICRQYQHSQSSRDSQEPFRSRSIHYTALCIFSRRIRHSRILNNTQVDNMGRMKKRQLILLQLSLTYKKVDQKHLKQV